MRYRTVALLVAAAMAVGACGRAAVDVEAERATLRAVAEAYHQAADSTDVDTLVGLYANDALMLPPNAPERRGTAEVRAFAQNFTRTEGFTIAEENLQVEVAESGDLGHTLADVTISYVGENGEAVTDTLRDFHLWEKRDGDWKLAIDIWNSPEPLPESTAPGPLDGAWIVSGMQPAGGDASTPAGPGQFIFHDGRYSAVYTVGTTERTASAEAFQPTDAEKVAQYDTLIVNSGTYEIDGNTVTMRPTVAKSPEFIGGRSTATYRVEGDTLTLTIESIVSAGGASPGDAAGSVMTLRRAN